VTLGNSESAAFLNVGFEIASSTTSDADGIATYNHSFFTNTTPQTLDADVPTELITIAKPDGDFVTGGGYLINQGTVGVLSRTRRQQNEFRIQY